MNDLMGEVAEHRLGKAIDEAVAMALLGGLTAERCIELLDVKATGYRKEIARFGGMRIPGGNDAA